MFSLGQLGSCFGGKVISDTVPEYFQRILSAEERCSVSSVRLPLPLPFKFPWSLNSDILPL